MREPWFILFFFVYVNLFNCSELLGANKSASSSCSKVILNLKERVNQAISKEFKLDEKKFDPNTDWKKHLLWAENIWSLYTKGTDLNLNKNCFEEELDLSYSDLQMALNRVFKAMTLKRIKKLNTHFFNKIKNEKPDVLSNLFVITSHEESNVSHSLNSHFSSLSAAYHLASRTVFVNFSKIANQDWDVFFLHELGHRLEYDQIYAHTINIQDPAKKSKLIDFLNEKSNKDQLLPDEIKRIADEMIWSGINIGLLAEWRVWNFVVDYLREVIINDQFILGEKTQWIFEFSKIEDALERQKAIFDYLDPNFSNTTKNKDWINDERIQERMQEMRSCIKEKISQKLSHQIEFCK